VNAVDRHYSRGDLLATILAGLDAAGISSDAPTVADLAPVDHLHTGGAEATRELLRLAGVDEWSTVLDVGGGLGGPARLLASELQCIVTVLDLTEEYVKVGRELTRRTGLAGRVTFVRGDALVIPFARGAFDVVWTQHSSMNVASKDDLYRELRRVLRPGGRLVLHEVMAGSRQPIHLPVPWASEPGVSHLRPPDEIRTLLAALGFRELAWDDQSARPLDYYRAAVAAAAEDDLPPLGLHLLLGSQFEAMFDGYIRNREEDRVRVVMGVWER
jgi:SAM-dependent methyltransferase